MGANEGDTPQTGGSGGHTEQADANNPFDFFRRQAYIQEEETHGKRTSQMGDNNSYRQLGEALATNPQQPS
jgi:hypothetical protein